MTRILFTLKGLIPHMPNAFSVNLGLKLANAFSVKMKLTHYYWTKPP
jgi:hypothetical protein